MFLYRKLILFIVHREYTTTDYTLQPITDTQGTSIPVLQRCRGILERNINFQKKTIFDNESGLLYTVL